MNSRNWQASGFRPSRRELLALAAIVAISGLVALRLIAEGAPLGHDEAAYALKSRQMSVGGSSAWYWNDYRAPGLPLILQITWLVQGTEPFLRLTVWVFGALGVVLVWFIGRTLFDARTGLIGAAGLALTPPWIASATSVWPDVPGAVLGLAAIAIILYATETERASWWILAAGPVALIALLVRYGALIPMGIGALAVMIWRYKVVQRSWPRFLALGLITGVGSLLILTVPGVVGTATSPWSSIQLLKEGSGLPITQGIRDYIRQADFIIGGHAGLLLIVGLALAALYAWRDPELRARWTFLMGVTSTTALVLVLILHGEYRYLSPVFPFAWVVAGLGLARASRRVPRETGLLVAAVLAVLIPLNSMSSAGQEVDKLSERFGELRVVSRAINAEHGYEECGIVTSYIPQVAWYTECTTRRFEPTPVLTSPFFESPQADYILFIAGGKRQPEAELLAAYLEATDGVFVETGDPNAGQFEYAVVYRVAEEG